MAQPKDRSFTLVNELEQVGYATIKAKSVKDAFKKFGPLIEKHGCGKDKKGREKRLAILEYKTARVNK